MGNLNKVMLIGNLTRDPELHVFADGGKVANIGLAVHNRRKNAESGEWEEVPVWVELKVYNRDNGRKLADLAELYLKKGRQLYVEGRLVLEEWNGKEDGKKRSKMVVHVDDLQFLGKREDATADAGKPAARKGRGATSDDALEEVPF